MWRKEVRGHPSCLCYRPKPPLGSKTGCFSLLFIIFQAACDKGLEGIVSKRRDSPYRSGRSPDWIKVKNPHAPAATRNLETW